jgi:hypothetical protein
MKRCGRQKVSIGCLHGRLLYSFGGYYILAPDRVKSFNRLIQKALGLNDFFSFTGGGLRES